MSSDNKRKLYDALSQDYDMGSFEQFCEDINDDSKRKKLYDATINEYDYGDYETFSSQLMGTPKPKSQQQKEQLYKELKRINKTNPEAYIPEVSLKESVSLKQEREKNKIEQPDITAPSESTYIPKPLPVFTEKNPYTEEEQRISAEFTPKPVVEASDIYKNYYDRFGLTERGKQLSGELTTIQEGVQKKYANEFLASDDYKKLSETYTGAELDEAANTLFAEKYSDKIEEELKPYYDAYQTEALSRYQNEIEQEFEQLQKAQTAKTKDEIASDVSSLTSSISRQKEDIHNRLSSKAGSGGNAMSAIMGSRKYIQETESDRKAQAELDAAQQLMDESNNIIAEAKKKGKTNFVAGLGRGLADATFDANTWSFGLQELRDNTLLLNALNKYDNGEQLTESEQTLMDAAVANMATNAYFYSDLGRGYKAGTVSGQSIPFMLEFAINPVSASGSAIAKSILKYGMQKFGKSAVKNNASKFAARLIGDMAAAGLMTGTTSAARVGAGAVERMTGDIQLDDTGTGYAGRENVMSAGEAVSKSAASTFLEKQSEMVFNAFKGLGNKIWKTVENQMPGGIAGVMDNAILGKVGDIYRKAKSNPVLQEVARRTQFHGLAEEYLEEVYYNFANIPLGEMTLEEATDLDNNIDTFLGLAPTSVAFAALGLGGLAMEKIEHRKRIKAALGNLTRIESKRLAELERMAETAGNEDIKRFIRETITSTELTPEEKKAEIDYAYNLAVGNAIDQLETEQKNETLESHAAATEEGRAIYAEHNPQTMRETVLRREIAEQILAATGMTQDDISVLANTPVEERYNAISSFDTDRRKAAEDYFTAIDRETALNDALDEAHAEEVTQARELLDSIMLPNRTVTIVPLGASATSDTEYGVVVSGINADGSPMLSNGEVMVYPVKLNNGQLDVDFQTPMTIVPKSYTEAMIYSPDEAFEGMLKAYSDDAAILDGIPMTVGAQFPIMDDNGMMSNVTILGTDQQNGRYIVSLNDQIDKNGVPKNTYIDAAELAERKKNAELAPLMQERIAEEQQRMEAEHEAITTDLAPQVANLQPQPGEKIMIAGKQAAIKEIAPDGLIVDYINETGDITGTDIVPLDAYYNYKQEQFNAQENERQNISDVSEQSGNVNDTEKNAGEQPSEPQGKAEQPYPTDESGEPAFTQMQPEQTISLLTSTLADDAASFVADKLSEAEKSAKKAAEKKPKSLSFTERVNELGKIAEEKAKAESELQYWQNISAMIYDRPTQRKRTRYVEQDKELGYAVTPYEHVLREIATGAITFRWSDLGNTQGLGSHLGLSGSNAERQKLIWTLSSEGHSPEVAAEIIHANMPENLQGMVTDQDVFNMILDAFGTYGSPSKMFEAAKEMHGTDEISMQRGYEEDMERQALEWEAEQNKMSVNDWTTYLDVVEEEMEKLYNSMSDEEINAIFEEIYNEIYYGNRRTEKESTGSVEAAGNTETGNEVQSGERTDNETADGRGETEPSETNQADEQSSGVLPEQGTESLNEGSGISPAQESIRKAEEDVNTNPTQAQKEAGNYKKGHVRIDGMDITIENPKGSTRSGVDANGKQWSVTMNNTYGYIRGTRGVDGDHIDIFLSDNPESGNVYVVDQIRQDTGEFDESKVLYGFNSMEEARQAYLSNYEKDWKVGVITEVTKEEFKKWIDSSWNKVKPFSEYANVKKLEVSDDGNAADINQEPHDILMSIYNSELSKEREKLKDIKKQIAEEQKKEELDNETLERLNEEKDITEHSIKKIKSFTEKKTSVMPEENFLLMEIIKEKSLTYNSGMSINDIMNSVDEDTINDIIDKYPDYIYELSKNGTLQKEFDESGVNDEIIIRNAIESSGYEIDDLINTSEKKNLTKKKRENERNRKSKELMEKLGINSTDIRFRFIGEQGAARLDAAEEATTRLDNLSIAREMEKSGKDAGKVKLATGWERGADGKWRYETIDIEYITDGKARKNEILENKEWYGEFTALSDKLFNGETLTEEEQKRFDELSDKADELRKQYDNTEKLYLDDYVKDKELFAAYPKFKQTKLLFVDNPEISYSGKADHKGNQIIINLAKADDVKSVLAHEIQHIIQEEEGFARGGNKSTARELYDKFTAWSWRNELTETQKENPDLSQADVERKLIEEYKETGMEDMIPPTEIRTKGFNLFARGYDKEGYEDAWNAVSEGKVPLEINGREYDVYNKLSGEVEARNVQARLGMTPEQRRLSLASETEDVSREDQIFINNALSSDNTRNEIDNGKGLNEDTEIRFRTSENLITEISDEMQGIIKDTPLNSDPAYNINNIGTAFYERSGYYMRRLPSPAERKVLKEGNIDIEHAKDVYDKVLPVYTELKHELINMIPNATMAARKEIAAYVEAINNNIEYYKELSEGKDVWRTRPLYRFEDEYGLTEEVARQAVERFEGMVPNHPEIYIAYTEDDLMRLKEAGIGENEIQDIKENALYNPNVGGVFMSKSNMILMFPSKAIDERSFEACLWHENTHYILHNSKSMDYETLTDDCLMYLKDKYPGNYNVIIKGYPKEHWNEEGITFLMQKLVDENGAEKIINAKFEGNDNISRLFTTILNEFKDETKRRETVRNKLRHVQTEASDGKREENNGNDGERRSGKPGAEQEVGRRGTEKATRQERIKSFITEQANKLNIPVTIYSSLEEVPEGKARKAIEEAEVTGRYPKGWYIPGTDMVYIYLPASTGITDAMATLLHEGVAHYGLRKMVGEKEFNEFLKDVYSKASDQTKKEIARLFPKYNYNIIEAIEEYIASIAEKGIKEPSFWETVKQMFRKMLEAVGYKWEITDNDIKYLLWESRRKLRESSNPIDVARETVMRNRLGIGEFGEMPTSQTLYRFEDRAEIIREYDDIIKSSSFRFQEAFQDSMLALKELQTLIEKYSGKKIRTFENAYTAENRLSSVNKVDNERYLSDFFEPLIKHIKELSKKSDLKSVEDYIYAKSGLERNDVFLHRDAQRTFDESKKELDDKLEKGSITQPQYDVLMKTVEADYNKFIEAGGDYSGLTALVLESHEDELNQIEDEAKRKKREDEIGKTYKENAEKIVSEFENKIPAEETDRLWQLIKAANDENLRKQFECGMINEERYNSLRNMMQYYVPLKGWQENVAEDYYDYTRTESPVQKEKKAKGRKSKADNPIANIALSAQNAIVMGNRNKMKQRFFNFVINRPNELVTIRDVWYEKTSNCVFNQREAVYPDIKETDDAATIEQKLKVFEENMRAKEEQGLAHRGRLPIGLELKFKSGQKQEHIVTVMINGQEYAMYINGNPRAAQAINGLTNPESNTNLGGQLYDKIKRFYGGGLTSNNPDFVAANFVRDTIHSATMQFLNNGIKASTLFVLNTPKSFKAVSRGIAGKYDANNKTDQYFQEFIKYGGETGYTAIHTIEDYKKEYERLLEEAKGVKKALKAGKKSLDAVISILETANRIAEDVNRFNAYMSSREAGKTIEESIDEAKNITVNFNKKGAYGQGKGAWGSLAWFMSKWVLFFNPSVQGIYQLTQAAKNNKKKVLSTLGTIMATGFITPYLNSMMISLFGGDDDDDYFNQNDYTRMTNWMLFDILTGNGYVKIPLPPFFRDIYGLGDIFYRLMTNRLTPEKAFKATLRQVQSAIGIINVIPEGEMRISETIGALAPDVFSPLVDIMLNRDFTGREIAKQSEWNKNVPEYERIYKGVSPVYVEASRFINDILGGDDARKAPVIGDYINPAYMEHLVTSYTGGIGKTVSNIVGMIVDAATGDTDNIEFRSVPIVNRFYSPVTERTVAAAINRVFYEYQDRYEAARVAEKRYNDFVKEGRKEYKEELEQMKKNGELEFISYFKTKMKILRKKQDRLRENPDDKKLEKEIQELKSEMIMGAKKRLE